MLELVGRRDSRPCARSGLYFLRTYLIIGWWPVAQYRPCSTYVSSLTMPASRIAKSAAVEVGNVCARYSAKSPVKPGSPGHSARSRSRVLTEVWNRRTCERFAGQLLDLDEHAGGLAVERAADDLHLDVAQLALAQGGDGVGAALGRREQHLVVVDPAVVACSRRCRRSGRTCRRRSRARAGASPSPG